MSTLAGTDEQMSNQDPPVETADEKARRLREFGDGTAVYGEVEQDDEQRDVNQPEPE